MGHVASKKRMAVSTNEKPEKHAIVGVSDVRVFLLLAMTLSTKNSVARIRG